MVLDSYYIAESGETQGPYSRAQLKSMWDQGLITSDTQYWTEGMDDWHLLSNLLEEQPERDVSPMAENKGSHPQISSAPSDPGVSAKSQSPSAPLLETGPLPDTQSRTLRTCPFCAEEINEKATKCKHCGSMLDGSDTLETKQAGLSIQAIQQMSFQTNFTLLPNETVLVEGLSSYIKSVFRVISCHAFLTNYRLIFCNKGIVGAQTLFGVVGVAAALARKPTKITFQVPVFEIKSLTKGRHGFASKYTVKTKGGTEYVVQFTKEDKWVTAIGSLGVECIV